MLTPCAAGEVVRAKLKCVYWITQHKDWGKGKNRDTLKTAGRRQGVWHGASFDGLPATTRGTGRTGRAWRKKREGRSGETRGRE